MYIFKDDICVETMCVMFAMQGFVYNVCLTVHFLEKILHFLGN
jgi:hypothetical protein